MRSGTTSSSLLVFGRGVTVVDGRYRLTAESLARVATAVAYLADHRAALVRSDADGHRPRVVFTGGWALADSAGAPPDGCREGDLMLAAARVAGAADLADLRTETRSRSTLENVLHTVEDRLFADRTFTAARPLGVVTHRWHLPRVRYLVGKVFGIGGEAVLDIPVVGGPPRPAWSERMLAVGSRLCFLGAADPVTLRRRERLIVASSRLGRRRPPGEPDTGA